MACCPSAARTWPDTGRQVCSRRGRALYFSRSPIPHHRDGAAGPPALAHLHLGLYAYRRDFLLGLAALPPSPLEAAEKLEQLRVLEAGYPIAVAVVEEPSVGIDTPEDYRRFVERWRAGGERSAGADSRATPCRPSPLEFGPGRDVK